MKKHLILNRFQSLLVPYRKTKVIEAVVVENGELRGSDALLALGVHWRKESAAVPPPCRGAEEFARRNLCHLDLSSARSPLPSHFNSFLRRAPNSGVGSAVEVGPTEQEDELGPTPTNNVSEHAVDV